MKCSASGRNVDKEGTKLRPPRITVQRVARFDRGRDSTGRVFEWVSRLPG